MTHEIKYLIQLIWEAQQQGLKSVLATVVALEGSSYRRPGVRMLIQENGKTFGAVSGGCVEKEIQRQAQSVLETNVPKVMTYDGRFRLGCEGIIYILIEPVKITQDLKNQFEAVFSQRIAFESESFYSMEEGTNKSYGTRFLFSGKRYSLDEGFEVSKELECFTQSFKPLFQLYLFGAEHDTVRLCKAAFGLGGRLPLLQPQMKQKPKLFLKEHMN